MNKLRLKVTANKLEAENDVFTTSGSANFDECVFTFDSTWDDLIKFAVFTFNNDDFIRVDIDNDRCNIPTMCLKREGMLRINVIGMDFNSVIITTNCIGHKVEEGVNDVNTVLTDE